MLEKLLNASKNALTMGAIALVTTVSSLAQPQELVFRNFTEPVHSKIEYADISGKTYQMTQTGRRIPLDSRMHGISVQEFYELSTRRSPKDDEENQTLEYPIIKIGSSAYPFRNNLIFPDSSNREKESININECLTYIIVPENVTVGMLQQIAQVKSGKYHLYEALSPLENTLKARKTQEFAEGLMERLRDQGIFIDRAIDKFLEVYSKTRKKHKDQFSREGYKVIEVTYWPLDQNLLRDLTTRQVNRGFSFDIRGEDYPEEFIPVTIYQRTVSDSTTMPSANDPLIRTESEWIRNFQIRNPFFNLEKPNLEFLKNLVGTYLFQPEVDRRLDPQQTDMDFLLMRIKQKEKSYIFEITAQPNDSKVFELTVSLGTNNTLNLTTTGEDGEQIPGMEVHKLKTKEVLLQDSILEEYKRRYNLRREELYEARQIAISSFEQGRIRRYSQEYNTYVDSEGFNVLLQTERNKLIREIFGIK